MSGSEISSELSTGRVVHPPVPGAGGRLSTACRESRSDSLSRAQTTNVKTTDAQPRPSRRFDVVDEAPARASRLRSREGGGPRTPPRGPLVITADLELLDHVLAAAAAAGVEPHVVDDAAAARSLWRAEQMIIVGRDRARQLASLALPRRAEVFLVGVESTRVELDQWSAPLGAAVIVLPEGSAWLTTAISDVTGRAARTGLVLAVVGGCGGIGASTLAAGLAVGAAARGIGTMLVDLDPLGAGIDLLMGVENRPGWRWSRLATAQGHLADLSDHLPRIADVGVLASDRTADGDLPIGVDAVRSVLTSAARHHRLVVLDLPREGSTASREALRCADRAVVLVGADVRGVAAGRQLIGRLSDTTTPLSAVVRVPRGGGIEPRMVAETLGLDLLAVLGEDPGLRRSGDGGEPPGRSPRSPLAKTSHAVLESVGMIRRRAA